MSQKSIGRSESAISSISSEHATKKHDPYGNYQMRSRHESLTYAAIASAAAFVVLYLSSWTCFRCERNIFPRQSKTISTLRTIAGSLRDYQNVNHKLPDGLLELPDGSAQWFIIHFGRIQDEWENELEYHPGIDGSFELFSFGRDGRLGGIGLDADLYHDDRNPLARCASFVQYFFINDRQEVRRDGFLFAAIAVSFCVFVSAYRSTRRNCAIRLGRITVPKSILLQNCLLIALSIAAGLILMPVHIPNGH